MRQHNRADVGDRVTIVGNANKLGSYDLSAHQGKEGVVRSNDGWGLCVVELDDGSVVRVWNTVDLFRNYSEPAPD